MNKVSVIIKTQENMFKEVMKEKKNNPKTQHPQTNQQKAWKVRWRKKKGANAKDRHSISFPLHTKKQLVLHKKEPVPYNKNKEASVKATLQRSYFRNATRENQETGRAHSRTEDDNKQVAAKNKKKYLKRYPKNIIATRGKRKKNKFKEKEAAGGQDKGKSARCTEVAREYAIKNMVAWRSH